MKTEMQEKISRKCSMKGCRNIVVEPLALFKGEICMCAECVKKLKELNHNSVKKNGDLKAEPELKKV